MNIIFYTLIVILGGLVGLLVYLSVPAVIAPILPDRYRYKVSAVYSNLATKAYSRMILWISKHNDATVYKSSFDPEKQAEEVERKDSTNDVHDPRGLFTRVGSAAFGLVYGERNEIVHPFDAVVGKEVIRQDERGEDTVMLEGKDGEPFTVYEPYVRVKDAVRGVDVRHALPMFGESYEPVDGAKAYENVKKSQSGFNSRNVLELGIVMITCGAAAILAWVIWSNSGDTDTAVTIPIQLMVMGAL